MIYTTAKQMESLDALSVKKGLAIEQMMELAGIAMVELFQTLKIGKEERVLVVCGKGNKAGDGLAAARHLYNRGYKNIKIYLTTEKVKIAPLKHLKLLRLMDIQEVGFSELRQELARTDTVIDALVGYHLSGALRGEVQKVVQEVNQASVRVIAYDMPSGLDATTGKNVGDCIKADLTLTLAALKKCFATSNGSAKSGKIYLADIGIPSIFYQEIGSTRPRFSGVLIKKI